MPRLPDPTVRTALIEAAAERLATDGLGALSLRAVAADVGTSTTAVYTHFGSKDDLIAAVVTEAFARLHDELTALPRTDDPTADLIAAGQAYRHNALANPHLYRVMFALNPLHLGPRPAGSSEPADPGEPTGTAGTTDDHGIGVAAFGALVEAIERCTDAGLLVGEPDRISLAVWAAVHGAVSLELAGFLGDSGEQLYADAATAALATFGTAPLTNPLDHP